MSRALIYDEPMVDKVHVRLEPNDAQAVNVICTREGRRFSDTVRQLVSVGLRIYPSFSSFAEIINTDLAGIARKILENERTQRSSTPAKNQVSQKAPKRSNVQRKKARPTRRHVVK